MGARSKNLVGIAGIPDCPLFKYSLCWVCIVAVKMFLVTGKTGHLMLLNLLQAFLLPSIMYFTQSLLNLKSPHQPFGIPIVLTGIL